MAGVGGGPGGRGSRPDRLINLQLHAWHIGTPHVVPGLGGCRRSQGDCLAEKRNHAEHPRANCGTSLGTIKMWAMYKSSGELIKMQDFQKLGKLAAARSHLQSSGSSGLWGQHPRPAHRPLQPCPAARTRALCRDHSGGERGSAEGGAALGGSL